MKYVQILTLLLTLSVATKIRGEINKDVTAFRSVANTDFATLAWEYDGSIVEVAVDFKIKELEIGKEGEAKMILNASSEKGAVGFAVKISKPQKSKFGLEEPVDILQSTLTITSIGEPTTALEQCLQMYLIRPGRARFRFVGIHEASFTAPAITFDSPAIFYTYFQGTTFDESGKRMSVEVDWFYQMRFIMDLPRNRVTVYFAERGGYGGSSPAASARRTWLESIKGMKK